MSLTKSNFRSGNIFAWLGLSLMHYWDHWWFEGWWVGGWTISGGGGIQPEGLPRVCCFGPRQLLQEWWVGTLFIPIKPKVTYRTFCKKKRHFDKEVAVSYFLVILVRKSSIGWWLHISRCVDYKQCSGGPNWPNQVRFLANLTCPYKFLDGKQKNTTIKKNFLGRKKGPFFWVFMNFWKWWRHTNVNFQKWWPQCSHHFRKFANCRLALSAHNVPTMFMNFRKWWPHTVSGHHFQKFATF